jgi:TolA-binding protein
MRRIHTAGLLAAILASACAETPKSGGSTLAELRARETDVSEVQVENSLDQAMSGYRKFLDEAPESELTPEAMRRLADLKLEKEYGIHGDEKPMGSVGVGRESDEEFERRAASASSLPRSGAAQAPELPGVGGAPPAGPLEAIALYDRILTAYPHYAHNDEVLYQKARAYDELARTEEAMAVMDRLVAEYPHSRHLDETQFRRGEYFFMRRKYRDAERAYTVVTAQSAGSEYYELALYKLGWSFYKQDLLEEGLDQFVGLLDYKVKSGYDFDQPHDEDSERRIADTFRVISLSFSNLGGPEALEAYFAPHGRRAYEDRVYSHLGEFYFEKLRYDDAAKTYKAFVALHPLDPASPHFSMRVIEIYEAAGFPRLVLEAKKEFAATYGLDGEYWRHFDIAAAPEVVGYLRTNLGDLAKHYHALYQDDALASDKDANFQESLRWYRGYLASFGSDPEAPVMNRRLADLLLEHEDFALAAREFERTAYEYPAHEGAADAGYAALYAHREGEKRATGEAQVAARREAVASTLRFVDAFPQHESAAAVLGAAVDDLYEMKDFAPAIATAQRLIDGYPKAEPAIRRSAWTVIAHASLETADYAHAEQAYTRVLELTPQDDASRPALVDNLAAAIYKQGEQASSAGDDRAAADRYLQIAQAAPTSTIRPAAEYDAAAALIRLKDWAGAAAVLEAFRAAYPDHPLHRDATKQIALVYRQKGDLARAAAEYERVAAEADGPDLRREALLDAGQLYEDAKDEASARKVYLGYVSEFPEPVENALETRSKLAAMFGAAHDEAHRREQLEKMVAIDAAAGSARTPRTRELAARAALALAEPLVAAFEAVALVQPFEKSLKEKQRRMDVALEALGGLVDYEIGEVTAAATFYMGELYVGFADALRHSERPAGLAAAELAEYERAIEQEAAPFSAQAIAVHQKNVELIGAGVYNLWIDKSVARLAELSPARYAHREASSGFVDSLETWAYRAPSPAGATPPEAAQASAADPAVPPPAALDSEAVDETVIEDAGEFDAGPDGAPLEASDAH